MSFIFYFKNMIIRLKNVDNKGILEKYNSGNLSLRYLYDFRVVKPKLLSNLT